MTLLGLIVGTLLGILLQSESLAVAGALLGTIGGAVLEVRLIARGREVRKGLEERVARLETSLSDLQARMATPQPSSADGAEAPSAVTTNDVAKEDTASVPPVKPSREVRPDKAPVPAPTDVPDEQEGRLEPPPEPPKKPFTPPVPTIASSNTVARPPSSPIKQIPRPTPSTPSHPQSFDSLRPKLLALLTGGNTLARVGVVVLLIGLAFLVQFAASQGLFPLELRLVGVALVGIVLTVLGWRLKDTRHVYALALQGGGVGVMYLAVFASVQNGLVPAGLGFALLVSLAVFSALLAVAQDALSLAVLGALGGFLAPIFASGEGSSHVLLFSYYLVLNVGILVVAWFKAWRPLNLLGFWSTLVLGGLWGGLSYEPALFASTEPFLILLFLLYLAVAVLYALRQPPKLRGLVDGTLVFGLPLVVFSLQAALVVRYPYGLAWSALVLGAVYLGLAWALFRYGPRTLRLLVEAFAAVGLSFVTLTLPFALDASWTGVGWALQGAGLFWVGVRQRRLWLRVSGLALQGLAAGSLLLEVALSVLFDRLSGGLFAFSAALVAFASLFVSYYLVHADRDTLRRWEGGLSPIFLVHGLLWWGIAGFVGLEAALPNPILPAAFLLFVTATALACSLLSARLRWPTLALPALVLLPVMVLTLFIAEPLPLLAALGWLAWPISILSFYWILRRTPELIEGLENLVKGLHAASLWFVTALVGLELAWLGSHLPGEAWPLVGAGVALTGAALLVTRFAAQSVEQPLPPALAWLAPYRPTYLTLGLTPVVVLLWLWGVGVNASAGDAAPLPYVPVLNPLDLTQVVALAALATWFLVARRKVAFVPKRTIWALIGFGVLWSSTVIARTVHHWVGVSYTPDALYASSVLQAALALFWTVLALAAMLYATRAQRRTAWLVGAGLLGLVVVKLFLVDLSSAGTVARIVSFVGVGALLLLIAYVAPGPPKGAGEDEPEDRPPQRDMSGDASP